MKNLTGRQWNLLIRLVNMGNTPEQVANSLTAEEMEAYQGMYDELTELRKTDHKATFWPVEIEW